MSGEESITVTEQLVASADFSDKKRVLSKYVEQMREKDEEFYALIDHIIVDEDQQGKIVESMKIATSQRKIHDNTLGLDTSYAIIKMVNYFSEQTEDRKKQRLTITYESTPSA